MHCEYSPVFKVCHASTLVYTKVAPGITIQFTATFLPTEMRDYKHVISFETEDEAFVVPIIGRLEASFGMREQTGYSGRKHEGSCGSCPFEILHPC